MNEKERDDRFRECCEQLRPMLWRLAVLYANPADREDLIQEILLKVWRKLPEFRGDAKLSTWVYRIGLYTGLNWRHRMAINQSIDSLEVIPESATASSPTRLDELECLQTALRRLREADRSILLLAMEGFAGSEMAEILGINENTANVRLHRARKNLQQQLEKIS